VVIDVRGRSEWEAGHIAGARHIPLGYLVDGVRDLSPSAPIIVHCRSGARSAIAASLLEAAGFASVVNLTGGFAAWAAGGRPVERPDATTPAGEATGSTRRVA
jgi:hydroxyacylglutathione hydrolase